jgi:glutamine amidotransferase-like uncharacterized protein
MKRTIALFLHQPKCSVQSGNGIIKSLRDNYNFKIFTKHELEHGFLDDVDAVCFPGGVGDATSYDGLLKENKTEILNFVNRGGKYIGICMGAYWAGKNYFDILKNDVDPVQYIKRPNTCTKRPHAKAMQINWMGQQEKMFFNDGCAFEGTDYETIATYPNGDAMGIIQRNIGLIGCHPESEPYWYTLHSWMKNHYHDGKHHNLLLQFLNRLTEK